ncbi:MAG: UDP-glucose:(heptosyl)LPS alpha,3-glucosyltransferase [Chthoniobacter sp.]|jgi:UDP-glucose:(heptosyl)LPS alpha-1,3-glucosyltransferase|nr:UDP-glucose:(heptosyl)LPS alpha,3-glucosyltransferase [Chthoniobacter sp.]
MKIALTFPGCHRRGGVERVMLECANFLATRGHETHAFANQWEVSSIRPEVVRHTVPSRRLPSALRLPLFARESRSAICALAPRADVIASFGVAAPPGSVVWMQSVHAAWLKISQRSRPFWGRCRQRLNPFHPVVLAMEQRLLGGKRYRKVIALSEQVRSDIVRFHGVPESDIIVVPNGFSSAEFNPVRGVSNRARMRATLGYLPENKVVVFVANELDRKGFTPLLRAIASLRDSRVHLLAVGRLDPSQCRGTIASLGMSERVKFTGPSNEVADFYAAADVFALPTQYEAWGLVIVEAMASGLRVLTSRLAGAAVAVDEGRTGQLLDDPADVTEIAGKLRCLLEEDGPSPEEISASVARYEWAQVLQGYESILAQCAT